MVNPKLRREEIRKLCAEPSEEDGIDPRKLLKPGRKRKKAHHKSTQLCRQVQRTVDLILSGETGDDLLTNLRVDSVQVGIGTTCLLVTVIADVPPDQFDPVQIENRLRAVQGLLRREVATAITRRKTPTLRFQVLPPRPNGPETSDRPD